MIDSGILAIIIFEFFLLLFIIVFYVIDGLKSRSRWLEEFRAAGYTVSREYIRNVQEAKERSFVGRLFFRYLRTWMITKNTIDFKITPFSVGGKHRRYYFGAEFTFPEDIRANLHLKIRKRGLFKKIFRLGRGQFHHIDPNMTIYSTNILIVKHLLNIRSNHYKLLDFLKRCSELDTSGNNVIRTGQSAIKLVEACDSVFPFVDALRKEIAEVNDERRYEITEILSDYDVDSAEHSCIICYQQVMIEEVLITNCCSSVAHADHIRTWLKSNKKCPYCRKKDIVLLAPVQHKAY